MKDLFLVIAGVVAIGIVVFTVGALPFLILATPLLTAVLK